MRRKKLWELIRGDEGKKGGLPEGKGKPYQELRPENKRRVALEEKRKNQED